MIKDREIVDVNLSICELLSVSDTGRYQTRLILSERCPVVVPSYFKSVLCASVFILHGCLVHHRNERLRNATELSNRVWYLKRNGVYSNTGSLIAKHQGLVAYA